MVKRPDVEKRAENLFLTGRDKPAVVQIDNYTKDRKEGANSYTPSKITQEVTSRPAITQIDKRSTPHATPKITPRPISTQDNTQNTNYTAVTTSNQKPIKSRKFKNLDGIEDGYYVIANVYKGGQYLNKFINKLEDKGIHADYIDNQKPWP